MAQPAGYALTAVQVFLIDVALAGDNALAVGMAAASLSGRGQRGAAITLGVLIAILLRGALAIVAVRLLADPRVTLAGGVLLIWVGWRLLVDLVGRRRPDGEEGLRPPRTFLSALLLIVISDLTMSLDNVLAVAGAARQLPLAIALGLLLSALLLIVASAWAAKLVQRYPIIGGLAVAVIALTSARMIWDGGEGVIRSGLLDQVCACTR